LEAVPLAVAYVAMSRGRDTNQAHIYIRDIAKAEHGTAQPVVRAEHHL
jgi:hypothetical protein